MGWMQKEILLAEKPRGFHLITDELTAQLPELRDMEIGLAHFFIQHTSASLMLTENADPSVRRDLEAHFSVLAPERSGYYKHLAEGPDDMPAHIKSAMLGASLTIPITRGQLNLGTWQGICLAEHREHGGRRRVVVTVTGSGGRGKVEGGR